MQIQSLSATIPLHHMCTFIDLTSQPFQQALPELAQTTEGTCAMNACHAAVCSRVTVHGSVDSIVSQKM